MGKLIHCILLCIIFLFADCHCRDGKPWVPLADKLICNTGRTFAEDYGLIFMGEGGAMFDCVHTMELAFQLRRPVSQDEGRILMVELMQRFLSAVNEDKSIRPYLDHYPATFKNIRITIFVVDINGCHLSYPYLGVISNVNDIIKYKYEDGDIYQFYKEIKKETYDEAVEIIHQQKINCIYRSFEKKHPND